MISINLLPDVKKDLLRVRRERNLVVSVSVLAVGASVAILVILGGWLGALAIAKNAHESAIDKSESTITKAKEDDELDKYLTIQNQLSQIDGLKDSQNVYSRLMDYLTQLNPAYPNNAALTTVTLDTESGDIEVTLEGTTQDFATLNVYKNTLINAQLSYETKVESDDSDDSADSEETTDDESSNDSDKESTEKVEATKEDLFSSVSVTDSVLSSRSDGSKVTFTIVVVFNPKAFDPNITNQTIEIPKETTSDGDRNAPGVEQNEEGQATSETFSSEANNDTTEGGNQ